MACRIALLMLLALALSAVAAEKRVMTFMDVMEMRSVSAGTISPDGKWVLYTVSIPRWKAGKNFTDIFLAPTDGSALPRQMTFTPEKNETMPRWARDSRHFAFLSDREGATQLYLMRMDGGEARRVSDQKDGVNTFAFSRDGKWLAYSAGKADERQIWLVSMAGEEAAPTQITRHATGVGAWAWEPNSTRIFFIAPDQLDKDDQQRKEKKFDVRIVNQEKSAAHLWSAGVGDRSEKRWTAGGEYSVQTFTIAPDSAHIALRTAPASRFSAEEEDTEVYLLATATGEVRRITENRVAETLPAFSADSKTLAFSAPDGFQPMRNMKVYLYPVPGGPLRKLLPDWDHNAMNPSWAKDSRTLYFSEGIGLNSHVFAISLADGSLRQLTKETGVVSGAFDVETGLFLFTYTNPSQPADYYVAQPGTISERDMWVRVSDANPQVSGFRLGQYETVRWPSKDGQTVEGILVRPVDYQPGKRCPLIVQVHGGPASAEVNRFSGSYGSYAHVFAGNGYAVLQPNYRGSDNYGEKFRMQISGDYFRLGFDDIMTGVDYLIARGIADPDKMGMMGWSAGGHWSNWALTHTDRFKAISSGAGAVNWISMYAETDQQAPREFYFKGKPWENWEHYLEVSPLRYIQNAKTPTLIHVGEADQRVPKPQSDELHMALKKLGVPTEYIVYPGMPHGLTEPRYQMVKMVAEFNWFEKWIKGQPGWFDWKALLASLEEGGEEKAPAVKAGSQR
jgi:dipeptidyl aminopeptidase/acylaminoacyl peptidase